MRKPAELGDDVTMSARMAGDWFRQISGQNHRPFLIREMFGMAEWQVEEGGQLGADRLVMTKTQRRIGDDPGQRVGAIHERSAPKGIARVLVQKDDQRQRAFGGAEPWHQFAPRGSPVLVGESIAKAVVEGLILAEPDGMAKGCPEGGNLAGERQMCLQAGVKRGVEEHSETFPMNEAVPVALFG